MITDHVTTSHHLDPDGLTSQPITQPQQSMDRGSLYHQGSPIQYGRRPTTQRPTRGPLEPVTEPAIGPAPGRITPAPDLAPRRCRARRVIPGRNGTADNVGPTAGPSTGDPGPMLFTPAQAADLLQVRESWLRRRAARRLVSCTFLGKHLRFCRANLEQILTDAARPAVTGQPAARGAGAAPRRRGRPPARARHDSHRLAR